METNKCEVCGKEIPQDQAIEVGENSGIYVCEDCYETECVKCSRCGDTIFLDEAHHTSYGVLCDCCNDDLFG